jgi:hypothetical protein
MSTRKSFDGGWLIPESLSEPCVLLILGWHHLSLSFRQGPPVLYGPEVEEMLLPLILVEVCKVVGLLPQGLVNGGLI